MAAKGKFFKVIKELTGNHNVMEEKSEKSLEIIETEQEKSLSIPQSLNTIISSSMIVEGEIKSSGNIEVIGIVKGPIITTGDLCVKGKVLGNIHAKNIILTGCAVQGNVYAEEDITLNADTVVLGDIQAKSVSMDPGAKLNGKVTILSDTLKEESPFSLNF